MSSEDLFNSDDHNGGRRRGGGGGDKPKKIPVDFFPTDPNEWRPEQNLYSAASESSEYSESSKKRKSSSGTSDDSLKRYRSTLFSEHSEEEERVSASDDESSSSDLDSSSSIDMSNSSGRQSSMSISEDSDIPPFAGGGQVQDNGRSGVHELDCPMCRYLDDGNGLVEGHISHMNKIWRETLSRTNAGSKTAAVQLWKYYQEVAYKQIKRKKPDALVWSYEEAVRHVEKYCYNPGLLIKGLLKEADAFKDLIAPFVRIKAATPLGVNYVFNEKASKEAREWAKFQLTLAKADTKQMFGGREDEAIPEAAFEGPNRTGRINYASNTGWKKK